MGVAGRGVGEAGTGVADGACVSVAGSEVIVDHGVAVDGGDVACGARGRDVSVVLGWQPANVIIEMETSSRHIENFIVPHNC